MTMRSGYAEGELCWADVQTRTWRRRRPSTRRFSAGASRTCPRRTAAATRRRSWTTTWWHVSRRRTAAGSRGSGPRSGTSTSRPTTPGPGRRRCPHAGGTVQFGPEEMADTGVMVFLDPPGGGTTGVWQAGTPHRAAGRYNEPGALRLGRTAHARAAGRRRIFPAAVRARGDRIPAGRRRHIHHADGGRRGGGRRSPPGSPERGRRMTRSAAGAGRSTSASPASRKRCRAAVAAGAEVLVEPERSRRAGTIATLKDPQGGVFSVLEV